jgi:hypothetical protein
MNADERNQLIDRYEQGHAVVLAALAGLDEAGLSAREAPGEWSVREIVHHLGDSEMTSAHRIRVLLAEDNPTIQGYDQDAFARNLRYDLPIEPSLAAFAAARAVTVPLLRSMSDADWRRAGTHSEMGPFSAERWLEIYGNHAHEHADQIRRARAAG